MEPTVFRGVCSFPGRDFQDRFGHSVTPPNRPWVDPATIYRFRDGVSRLPSTLDPDGCIRSTIGAW